jgi:MoaA/NifB/PqqE/SkfB family radical SAM enzyme
MNDLNTVELLALYEQALEFGYTSAIITGGEPFTRNDLPIILKYIRELNFKTHLITNGILLAQRWQEVKEYVNNLIISMDVADDELDHIRGKRDTFQDIVDGIDTVKQLSPKIPIVINSIIWRQNSKQIFDLAMFAKDMEVKINFYPMDASHRFYENNIDNRKNLALDYPELSEAFRQIFQLKKEKYPIINSDEFLAFYIDYKPGFICHFQKVFTQVMANGNVLNCSYWANPYGNIRNSKFSEIMTSNHTQRARKLSETCNFCNRNEVIETSMAFDWKIDPLLNILSLF